MPIRKRTRRAVPSRKRARRAKCDGTESCPESSHESCPESLLEEDEGGSSESSQSSRCASSNEVYPERSLEEDEGVASLVPAGVDPLPPAAPAVVYHESNRHLGRYKAPDGKLLATVSIMKPGTNQEAVSVYCARHGCTLLKRVHAAPSHDQIRDWVIAGLDIPAGRQAGLQARHKDMWKALLRTSGS